ncbi:MAG TPA: FAD-dependent thymidylate synthase [Candidatus Methanoperedens sp.]|nr:FAD-dependent thymidylate synthase [Candidatus Methanoperedens sp.]
MAAELEHPGDGAAMHVALLRRTAAPETAVALAARLCYSPDRIDDLERGVDAAAAAALIRRIVGLGHLSVLEHAVFTFGVEGISRAASHQLVRHRVASYSQQSQRYVAAREDFAHVVPPSVTASPKLARVYARLMRECGRRYSELLAAGVPAEDARFVLPNAAATRIIVTMNARELRHFFTLRGCLRAQWEIRELAERMLGLARAVAPVLFEGCGPACVRGACPEGKLTCGRRLEVHASYRDWPLGAPRPTLAAAARAGKGRRRARQTG